MFSGIDDLSARDVLLAVEDARDREMSAQAETMALAAHWCDLHGQVGYDREGRVRLGAEELVDLGGDGTPQVEELCAAEFGAMRHQKPGPARNLLADALDLRHRLPHVWAAMLALRIEVWVARKIAKQTRALSRQAAAQVDAAIADHLESLPVARLLDLVEAETIKADPDLAEQRRQAAQAARYVRTTKDGDGMMLLIARASAGDTLILNAMIDRIAEILGDQGDPDPIDVRRSQALGWLARPHEALRLLLHAAHHAGIPDHQAETELAGETDPPQPEPEPQGEPERTATPGRIPLRELLASSANTAALRPRTQLFVHLTPAALTGTQPGTHPGTQPGVARVEGIGAVLLDQVREWLGPCEVKLTPVIDLPGLQPVDAYETPAKIREGLHQVSPTDAFPWSDDRSRRKDADHCTPYTPPARGGPPGQTGLHNLAPLTRHHHRIKTFTDWNITCLSPGRYQWRSPHDFHFLVDQDGTHRLPERLHHALRPIADPEHSHGEDRLVKLLLRTTHRAPAA